MWSGTTSQTAPVLRKELLGTGGAFMLWQGPQDDWAPTGVGARLAGPDRAVRRPPVAVRFTRNSTCYMCARVRWPRTCSLPTNDESLGTLPGDIDFHTLVTTCFDLHRQRRDLQCVVLSAASCLCNNLTMDEDRPSARPNADNSFYRGHVVALPTILS